jgi:hypothetical protein
MNNNWSAEEIEVFCEQAIPYCCNSSCYLVDWERKIATHLCSETYTRADWDAVYPPTDKVFQEFLADPNWVVRPAS